MITFADSAVEAICLANWDTDGNGYLMMDEAESVTSLGNEFKDNTEIISFEEFAVFIGLTRIKNNAFAGCTSLNNIVLPDTLQVIEYDAFKNASLNNLDIVLKNVATIQEGAFRNNGMRSVVAPNIVTIMSSYGTAGVSNTFASCSSLEYVLLGKTCESVGTWGCFQDSTIATLICCAVTPPSGGNICVNTPIASGNGYIYVPDDSVTDYQEATAWASLSACIKGISELATDDATLYAEIEEYL